LKNRNCGVTYTSFSMRSGRIDFLFPINFTLYESH
jgi:hypothetical protein